MEKWYILSINMFTNFWNVSSQIQITACSSKKAENGKMLNLEYQQVQKLLKCFQAKYLKSLHKHR